MVNVMVTGSGGGCGQSIVKALRLSNTDYRIITTDMSPLAAGIYRGEKGYLVPPAKSPDFIGTVIGICQKEDIDVLLIGSDPELPVLAENKGRIEEETNTKVAVSSPQVVGIGSDKWETYKFLRDNGFHYPRSALPQDMHGLVKEVGFPLIIKPRTGSASREVYVADNAEEMEVFVKRVNNPILQEYLGSVEEEYTSGAVAFSGQVFGVITMKREIRGGVSYRVIVDDYESVKGAVISIAKKLDLFGPCNFQMRVSHKAPTAFEINTRFSGTTAIRATFGFNEPDAVIRYILHNEVSILNYSKGIVLRYWNEVYIPPQEYSKLKRERKIENSESKIMDYF